MRNQDKAERIPGMKRAVKNANGNFEVFSEDGLKMAVIVNTKLGWRVNPMFDSARRGSRTHSATPQEAAKKYFKGAVKFEVEVKFIPQPYLGTGPRYNVRKSQ
jgi:hypothetical protein